MKAGLADIGVIEVPGGFVAGRAIGGDIVAASEIPLRDQAFLVASEAARSVAGIYRSRRNLASARYYERKAAQLAEQIE